MKKLFRLALVFALAGATLMYTGCTKDYAEEIKDLEDQDSSLSTKIEQINTAIAALESAADHAKDIKELNGSISTINDAIQSLQDAAKNYATKTEVADAEANAKKAASDALDAAIKGVNSSIEGVKTDVKALKDYIDALKNKNLDAETLAAAVAAASKNSTDIADLKETVKQIATNTNDIASLQNTVKTLATKEALNDLADDVKALEEAAETFAKKTDLDAAKLDIANLQTLVATLATATSVTDLSDALDLVEDAIDNLDATYATDADLNALKSSLDTFKSDVANVYATKTELTSVSSDVATLKSQIIEKADKADLEALQTTVGTLATAAALESAKDELSGGIAQNSGLIASLQNKLSTFLGDNHDTLDENLETLEKKLNSAIEALGGKVEAYAARLQSISFLPEGDLSESDDPEVQPINFLSFKSDARATAEFRANILTQQIGKIWDNNWDYSNGVWVFNGEFEVNPASAIDYITEENIVLKVDSLTKADIEVVPTIVKKENGRVAIQAVLGDEPAYNSNFRFSLEVLDYDYEEVATGNNIQSPYVYCQNSYVNALDCYYLTIDGEEYNENAQNNIFENKVLYTDKEKKDLFPGTEFKVKYKDVIMSLDEFAEFTGRKLEEVTPLPIKFGCEWKDNQGAPKENLIDTIAVDSLNLDSQAWISAEFAGKAINYSLDVTSEGFSLPSDGNPMLALNYTLASNFLIVPDTLSKRINDFERVWDYQVQSLALGSETVTATGEELDQIPGSGFKATKITTWDNLDDAFFNVPSDPEEIDIDIANFKFAQGEETIYAFEASPSSRDDSVYFNVDWNLILGEAPEDMKIEISSDLDHNYIDTSDVAIVADVVESAIDTNIYLGNLQNVAGIEPMKAFADSLSAAIIDGLKEDGEEIDFNGISISASVALNEGEPVSETQISFPQGMIKYNKSYELKFHVFAFGVRYDYIYTTTTGLSPVVLKKTPYIDDADMAEVIGRFAPDGNHDYKLDSLFFAKYMRVYKRDSDVLTDKSGLAVKVYATELTEGAGNVKVPASNIAVAGGLLAADQNMTWGTYNDLQVALKAVLVAGPQEERIDSIDFTVWTKFPINVENTVFGAIDVEETRYAGQALSVALYKNMKIYGILDLNRSNNLINNVTGELDAVYTYRSSSSDQPLEVHYGQSYNATSDNWDAVAELQGTLNGDSYILKPGVDYVAADLLDGKLTIIGDNAAGTLIVDVPVVVSCYLDGKNHANAVKGTVKVTVNQQQYGF